MPNLATTAVPFLTYLDTWYAALPDLSLDDVIGAHPEQVALISVDMINGFCYEGPLASPRVANLVAPIAQLFAAAYARGVRAMLFAQDTHSPHAEEFHAYPPHCIRGTSESEAVDALKQLSFYEQITIVEKNALSAMIGTRLLDWITAHSQVQTYIIVGDCTDLCVYTMAMDLRMHANAHDLKRRVIVPAAAVDTFDTPLDVAAQLGIKAHPAELHHVLFLHQMAMNGVEVVRDVTTSA